MTDDYLWQRSGRDPEIEALERQLGGLAHRHVPLPLPAQPRRSYRALWAIAAALVLTTIAALAVASRSPTAPTTPGWALRGSVGAVRCDATTRDADCELAVGGWLDTTSALRLTVADIGAMDIEPGTRLGLLASGADEHRLKLEHGTIHASVLAPPRLLIVETPAVTAVDLGCKYTLSVDPSGAGFLAVESGWVALELPGLAVHVPAGARAETRPGRGPGVPYFLDAPAAIQQLAHDLSFETAPSPALGLSLATALAVARPQDSLSLYHLLPRLTPTERTTVLERIAALVPDVASLTDAAQTLDPAALERLRERLTPTWG